MTKPKSANIVHAMRPSFLILTPVCILLAVATAQFQGLHYSLAYALLCLVGALTAHIAVNTLNEYQDFHSGLDLMTQRTDFSGGSGLLVQHPHLSAQVFKTSLIALAITAIVGIYFITIHGWKILPIGLLGLLVVMTYTKWINKQAWLCLIAPGLGFGTFMVTGTYLCITGAMNTSIWLISLIPFFLINNLLLVNQIPDIDADTQVGRNHLAIKHGIGASIKAYGIFIIFAQLTLIYLVLTDILPLASIVAIIPMLLGYFVLYGMIILNRDIASAPKYLAANVICSNASPTLLALSLFFA